MKKTIMQLIFPIVSVFFMLLDGQLTKILMSISEQRNVFSVQLLLICFFIGYFYFEADTYLLSVACFIGILYDVYYYGVIGIFAVSLPLTLICFNKVIKKVIPNIFIYLIVFVMTSLLLQVSAYLLQIAFGLVNADISTFVILYIAPSLFLNTIIYLVALLYGYNFFLKQR